MQFIKFCIIGVSNTIISYLLYVCGLWILNSFGNFQYSYLIATLFAFLLSVLWSFYWNNRAVFVLAEGQTRSIWRSLAKTYISYSLTGVWLSGVLLIVWVDICGISELIAPLINLVFTVPINFFINKFWAFKARRSEK